MAKNLEKLAMIQYVIVKSEQKIPENFYSLQTQKMLSIKKQHQRKQITTTQYFNKMVGLIGSGRN